MKISIVSRIGTSFLLATMLFTFYGMFFFKTTFAASIGKLPTAETTGIPVASAASLPSLSCQQPDRQQAISTLTLQERIAQGYPIPINGKTDPTTDQIIHDKGKHFCTDTDVRGPLHSSQRRASAAKEYNSRNWSGNYADGGKNYTYAQASWTESCATWGTNDHYSTWVGIGGINGNLVQAGAEDDNTLTIHRYVAWIQNTDVSQYETTLFNINCGDNMLAEVGAGNCTLIVDQTSGASVWVALYGSESRFLYC